MTAPTDHDPFAGGDSAPSLSWLNVADGTVRTVKITEAAKVVQSRDYRTQEPAFWPAKNGRPPEPKMAAVLAGTDEKGEPVSIWAVIRGEDLFFKIRDAQKELGRAIEAGDVVKIKLTHREPTENGYPKKVFAVKIEAAPKPPPADAFGDDPWSSKPAAPATPGNEFGEPPF